MRPSTARTLINVASPVVLPAAVLAALDDLATDDLAELVATSSDASRCGTCPRRPSPAGSPDAADLEVLAALSSSATA